MVVFNEAEINYDHSSGDIVVFSRYNSKEVGEDGNKIIGSISILLLQNGKSLQSTISKAQSSRQPYPVTQGITDVPVGQLCQTTVSELGENFDLHLGQSLEENGVSQLENTHKYSVPSSLSIIPLSVPFIQEQVNSRDMKDDVRFSDNRVKEDGTGKADLVNEQESSIQCSNVIDNKSNISKKALEICENLCKEKPYEIFDNDVDKCTTIFQPTLPPDLMSFDSTSFENLRLQTQQNLEQSSVHRDNYWTQYSSILSNSKNVLKTPLNIPKVPLVSRLIKSNQNQADRCNSKKLAIGLEFNDKKKQLKFGISGMENCLFCREVLVTHENVVRHALDHLSSFSDEIFCPVCSMVFKNNEINDFLQHAYTHFGNKTSQDSPSPVSTQMIGESISLADPGTCVFDDSSSDRLSENFFANIGSVISSLGSGCAKDTSDLYREPDEASLELSHSQPHKVKRKAITKNSISHSCYVCHKTIASYKDILKHQKNHGPSNSCPICQVEFTQRGSFMRHAASHMRTTLFMCQLCPSVFTRKDNLKRHIDKHGMFDRPRGKSDRLVKKPWRFKMYYAQAANRLKKMSVSLNEDEKTGESNVKSLQVISDSSDNEIDENNMDNEKDSYLSGNTTPTSQITYQNEYNSIVPGVTEREKDPDKVERSSESNGIMSTNSLNMSSSTNESNVITAKEEVQKRNLFDDLVFRINENDDPVSKEEAWDKSDIDNEAKLPDKSPNINYTCTECKEEFCKLENLKKHMVIFHSEQKQETIIHVIDNVDQDKVSMAENLECSQGHVTTISKDLEACRSSNFSSCTISEIESNMEFHISVEHDMFENESHLSNIKKEKDLYSISDSSFKGTVAKNSTMLLPSEIKKEPANLDNSGSFFYETDTGLPNNASAYTYGPSHLSFTDDTFPTKHSCERSTMMKARKNTQHAQCSYCDVVFATASEISQHCTVHRDKVLNHFTTCPVCRIELSTRGGLHRHAATHIGLIFSCGYCSARFSRKDNLKRHVKLNHGADLEMY